jgi:hypothetical protein
MHQTPTESRRTLRLVSSPPALGSTTKWTMAAAAREYREALAIDKAIQEDPAKRDAWVKRQLQLELVQEVEEAAEV